VSLWSGVSDVIKPCQVFLRDRGILTSHSVCCRLPCCLRWMCDNDSEHVSVQIVCPHIFFWCGWYVHFGFSFLHVRSYEHIITNFNSWENIPQKKFKLLCFFPLYNNNNLFCFSVLFLCLSSHFVLQPRCRGDGDSRLEVHGCVSSAPGGRSLPLPGFCSVPFPRTPTQAPQTVLTASQQGINTQSWSHTHAHTNPPHTHTYLFPAPKHTGTTFPVAVTIYTT